MLAFLISNSIFNRFLRLPINCYFCTMTQGEFVSRVSNQVRAITKDDYINSRFILSVGLTLATKFLTQKIQRFSLDRDMSLFKEVQCIEFEPVNVFKCKYVEFKNCNELSKSKKSVEELGLIFTRYGSSIKELYSIDRTTSFSESTLYQIRIDHQRKGYRPQNNFYLLDGHLYIPKHIKTLSGLFLALNQYELDEFCDCEDTCESAWKKEFVAPSSMIEDIIQYSVQNILQTKSVPIDEKPNLNNNEK